MWRRQNYNIRLDPWGLLLFAVIMLPNLIWFLYPAPNDILRRESLTPVLDKFATLCQIAMVGMLCVLRNRWQEKPIGKAWRIDIAAAVALYFAGWALYYMGWVNAPVILDLCVAPCAAFLLFSAARKNAAALLFGSLFLICHLVYGMVNFMVL